MWQFKTTLSIFEFLKMLYGSLVEQIHQFWFVTIVAILLVRELLDSKHLVEKVHL